MRSTSCQRSGVMRHPRPDEWRSQEYLTTGILLTGSRSVKELPGGRYNRHLPVALTPGKGEPVIGVSRMKVEEGQLLWTPSAERVARSHLTRYLEIGRAHV